MNIESAPKQSGIYEIRNLTDGKVYVGSAVNLRQRFNKHNGALRSGSHFNPHLQNAYNKYGADSFSFKPILFCSRADLLFYEQRALDTIKSKYNILPTAGSMLGHKASEASKAAMRKSHAGRPSRKYEYAGEKLTLNQLVELSGVPKTTIRYRFAQGWEVCDAIEVPTGLGVYDRSNSEDKPYKYKGARYTLTELIELTGMVKSTLSARLQRGWSVEAAVETRPGDDQHYRARAKKYVYEGKEFTGAEIGEMAIASAGTVRGRLDQGWDIKRAIETPNLRGKKRG